MGWKKRVGLAFMGAAVVAGGCSQAPGGASGDVARSVADVAPASRRPDEAELHRRLEQRLRDGRMVGLGAAVLVDAKLAWAGGFGYADREARRPFTPATILNIGSITKTVTGVALMRAAEQGKLTLDDDVNLHLPFTVRNPRFPGVPITLRHLATHTSSIFDRPEVYERAYVSGGDSTEPLAGFLRDYFVPGAPSWSPANFLDAKPGTYREYSNLGASLAGYAVEQACGMTLQEYTRREIFVPLGMTKTSWTLAGVAPEEHAKLYDAEGETTTEVALYGLTTYPDGALRTSVAELARLFGALLGGGELDGVRILARASVDEMLRFQFTPANRPENLELSEKNEGIFWSTKMDTTLVGHGGSDPGVKTEMLALPSKEVGVIVFTNTSLRNQDMRQLFGAIQDLLEYGKALRAAGVAGPAGEAGRDQG